MGWKHEETKTLIFEAIEAIKERRIEDALLILERDGRPKWHSSGRAAEAYAAKKSNASVAALSAYTGKAAA